MYYSCSHYSCLSFWGEFPQSIFGKCIWIISWLYHLLDRGYLAWMMFATYVGYTIISHVLPKTAYRKKYLWFLHCIVDHFCYHYLDWIPWYYTRSSKMKWFIARWYLWKTGFSALTANIWSFSFLVMVLMVFCLFQSIFHPLLSVYEDPAYRIDRSHNVFLDFDFIFDF